jgi:hypothetical protein
MTIIVTPEFSIPIPVDLTPQEMQTVQERAKAAFRTRQFLLHNGLVTPNPEIPEDRQYIEDCAREAAKQFTGHPTAQRRPFNSETTAWLNQLVDKYHNQVVEDSVKLRTYVKTRLVEESDPNSLGEKASDRLKALESLGKLSDLGMFADKIDISVNMKSTAELEEELAKKLSRYMGPADVVTSPVKKQRQAMVIDLDKELGRNAE